MRDLSEIFGHTLYLYKVEVEARSVIALMIFDELEALIDVKTQSEEEVPWVPLTLMASDNRGIQLSGEDLLCLPTKMFDPDGEVWGDADGLSGTASPLLLQAVYEELDLATIHLAHENSTVRELAARFGKVSK